MTAPAPVTGPDGFEYRATELEGLQRLERRLRTVQSAAALSFEVDGAFMTVPTHPEERWLTASGLTREQHAKVTAAAQAERTARGENINLNASARIRDGWAAQARALFDAHEHLPDGEEAGRTMLRARLIDAASEAAHLARIAWSAAFDERYARVRALLWVAADVDLAWRGTYAALGLELEEAKASLNRDRARLL